MTITFPLSRLGRRRAVGWLAGAALSIGLCAPVMAESATARVALQFGIGYLPLSVMQSRNLWELRAKEAGVDLKVEWQNLGNGAALNDAILTGSADIAAGGLTPMLKLWDKTRRNLKVRGIAALSTAPMLLVTDRPDLKTIGDLKPDDKIAGTPIISIQAIVLQMAAAQKWGMESYARLDSHIVAMKHSDAVAAMLSDKKFIAGHFSSPPFQDILLAKPGFHVMLNSEDVLGQPATFNVAYTTERFVKGNPKVYTAFVKALNDAVEAIKADKEKAVDDYMKVSGTSESQRPLLISVVNNPRNQYATAPKATMKYATFMASTKQLSTKADSWRDYFFEQSNLPQGD